MSLSNIGFFAKPLNYNAKSGGPQKLSNINGLALAQKIHKYALALGLERAYILRMETKQMNPQELAQVAFIKQHGYSSHILPVLTGEQRIAIALEQIERAFGSKK